MSFHFHESNSYNESQDEVRDQVLAMRRQEKTNYFIQTDYLSVATRWHKASGKMENDMMSDTWRKKMCVWSYMVVDHFGFDREVVEISFSYLDRYLSVLFAQTTIGCSEKNVNTIVDKMSFQLLAATSLYIAIKTHGISECDPSKYKHFHLVDTFAQLSRGIFTSENILFMERQILSALEWYLNPPTSVIFAANFLQLPNIKEVLESFFNKHLTSRIVVSLGEQSICCDDPMRAVFEIAKFFTELSTGDYTLSTNTKPSCVAVASIINAIQVICKANIAHRILSQFLKSLPAIFGNTLSMGEEELSTIFHVQVELFNTCPRSLEDRMLLNKSNRDPMSPSNAGDDRCPSYENNGTRYNKIFSSRTSPVSAADLQ